MAACIDVGKDRLPLCKMNLMKKTILKQVAKLFVLAFIACTFLSFSKPSKAEFLNDFYTNCVLGYTSGWVEILKENSSERLQEYLIESYPYDCEEGDCYDIARFRTDHQDSNYLAADVSKVVEIIKLTDDSYRVRYLDMGWKGSTVIKFVEENGKFVMDEIVDETGVDPYTIEDGEYVTEEEL